MSLSYDRKDKNFQFSGRASSAEYHARRRNAALEKRHNTDTRNMNKFFLQSSSSRNFRIRQMALLDTPMRVRRLCIGCSRSQADADDKCKSCSKFDKMAEAGEIDFTATVPSSIEQKQEALAENLSTHKRKLPPYFTRFIVLRESQGQVRAVQTELHEVPALHERKHYALQRKRSRDQQQLVQTRVEQFLQRPNNCDQLRSEEQLRSELHQHRRASAGQTPHLPLRHAPDADMLNQRLLLARRRASTSLVQPCAPPVAAKPRRRSIPF